MIARSILIYLTLLSAFLSNLQICATHISTANGLNRIDQELGARLSPKASILHYSSAASRWSTYHAPKPGTIVNVAEENDVVETLKYCIENNLDFLVQSGGHGWATTFNIDEKDVLINMRGLNKVRVSDDKGAITFEGGALVGEVLEAAYQSQVETTIPTCNCVGMAGAALGGGFNRLIALYGLVIDNLLSINLVTADAELITVTPISSPDLWWALCGAGANFGIVTSMTLKVYPPVNNGMGWVGTLVFTPEKLEDLVQTLSDFDYTMNMLVWFYFRPTPPEMTPSIALSLWYTGSEAEAKAAFKPLYDLGPASDTSQEVPYNKYTSDSDPVCAKGFRRPTYSAGLKKLDPGAFRKIWDEYVSLVSQNPNMNGTVMAIEAYSPEAIQTYDEFSGSFSAFPHREFHFLAIIGITYDDASLDPIAENFGEKVRELWKQTSGFEDLRVYVNAAHGDEDLRAVYGESLCRLKEVKKVLDKHGRFSQFFPIPI